MEGMMFKEFGRDGLDFPDIAGANLAHSGELDALVALEQIGTRRSFTRDEEIYAEGDPSECWFRVVSGTVRICKLLPDGRRHIAEFCLAGDCFGMDNAGERGVSAEAVGEVVVMRYPRRATERLLDERPELARRLCSATLRELAHAQTRMLLLGRMTAAERVAAFLLELSERNDTRRAIEVPMSRTDIADYLGLTIETVCRVLSAFKRDGAIAISGAHRIEFRDRDMLVALCET
jgi:CRP/FNR family transcriptional regulator, nitrogen fixation regulation protein